MSDKPRFLICIDLSQEGTKIMCPGCGRIMEQLGKDVVCKTPWCDLLGFGFEVVEDDKKYEPQN